MLQRKIAQVRHSRHERQSKAQRNTTVSKVTGFVSSSASTAKSLAYGAATMAVGITTAEATHNGSHHHHHNHSATLLPTLSLSSTAATNISTNVTALAATGVEVVKEAASSSGIGTTLLCLASATAIAYAAYKTNAAKHCRDYFHKRTSGYSAIESTDEFDVDLDEAEKAVESKRNPTTYQSTSKRHS